MNRHLRYAALLGACTLGIGCASSEAPGESTFVPAPEIVAATTVSAHTRISGVAWDPEAFHLTIMECGPACPLPPYLSEGLPTFARATVAGASISAFDPLTGGTVGNATPDALGIWEIKDVPSRSDVPFFIIASGAGQLAADPFSPPLSPIPPTTYLKTLTGRPIRTVTGVCTSMGAAHIGQNGILEAVAKYLTSKGRATTVQDLVDPAKYHSVVVLGLYHAGNSVMRAPADGTSVEVSAGQVYYLNWAPPGTAPANLRSQRGFIVTESTTTPMGFAVALLQNTGSPPPAEIEYHITDTVTDAVARRPWVFPPIAAPPDPGVVTFIEAQMFYAPKANPVFAYPPPPSLCL